MRKSKIEKEDKELKQLEYSAEIATDFIHDEILSRLDEFENNEDSDYVYGMATQGLFAELIARLGEMGYTERELRKEIKVWLNSSAGQIIH